MSDYISREAALEAFENADADVMEDYGDGTSDWGFGRENIRETLISIPAADVEPVVHGRWEKSEYRGFVRCSVCKDAYIDEDWLSSGKWGGCPNCRAKMDLAPPEGDNHG